MKIKQQAVLLLLTVILIPIGSTRDAFQKAEDYLAYIEEKLESAKFDEYDLTLMRVIDESPLSEEEIKEKVDRSMNRQKILGLTEDDPEYVKTYEKYYDLFKNSYSSRIFKLRAKNTPNFYLVSDRQYQRSEIENGNLDKGYITTFIHDKKKNKFYTVQHNSRSILIRDGNNAPHKSQIDLLLLPETSLSFERTIVKMNSPKIPWTFKRSENKQPNSNQQSFEFTLRDDMRIQYDVSLTDPPNLIKNTRFSKNVILSEMVFSDFLHIESKDVNIAKKYELSNFDGQGALKGKETYTIEELNLDLDKKNESIEDVLSSFKGYEYCVSEGHHWKAVGKIDQNGVLKMEKK